MIVFPPEALQHALDAVSSSPTRALVIGAPGGSGAAFITQIARLRPCNAIFADPGLPFIGLPTTIGLARWDHDGWVGIGTEGLATLDAGRFRSPVVRAVSRLARRVPSDAALWVDAPTLLRGVPAAELMQSLCAAVGANVAILLRRSDARDASPLLHGSGVLLRTVEVPEPGRVLSEEARRAERDARWKRAMADAVPLRLDLGHAEVTGLPPAENDDDGWSTRVVALLDATGETCGVGWVASREANVLAIRAQRTTSSSVRGVCVRDTRVDSETGELCRWQGADATAGYASPPETRGRAFALSTVHPSATPIEAPTLGSKNAVIPTLVNGVLGDPLLHIRVVQERHSVLFDLGDAHALPRRIAHQVRHVCVTHAHMDHLFGLGWLLRMRVGIEDPCPIVGPPGMAERVAAQVQAFTWNLVGDKGPRFEVAELHGNRLLRYHVQAGRDTVEPLGEREVEQGILHDAGTYCLRAVTLDHKVPVLAYSFDLARATNVRDSALGARGWEPGPWIGVLKRAMEEGLGGRAIALPDGTTREASVLAAELLETGPVRRLVYATDLADTPANRDTLVAFAAGADVLVCEASFLEEDRDRAESTAHLTAGACGAIAAAAGVGALIPFHFSARYESDPGKVVQEVAAAFDRTHLPDVIAQFTQTPSRARQR